MKYNKTKKILIVDDDLDFLKSLEDSLKSYNDPYVLITASSGEKAVEILSREDISLLITDIKMPDIDGITLITELFNSGKWLPTIVVSAYGTPKIWEKLKDLGICSFIDKPLNINDLREKILDVLKQTRKDDDIRGMGLAAVLQLMEFESKTGVITVVENELRGVIFVKEGKCVDAICGNKLTGKDALICLLKLQNPHINIHYVGHNRKKRIKETLPEILLEFARLEDEEEQNKKEVNKMANKYEELQKLEETLLNETGSIIAVAVASTEDGMSLAGASKAEIDLTVPSGYFNDAFHGVTKAFKACNWGEPDEILISGKKFNVILTSLKNGAYYQGTTITSDTSLGLIRAILKKYKTKIESLLP